MESKSLFKEKHCMSLTFESKYQRIHDDDSKWSNLGHQAERKVFCSF